MLLYITLSQQFNEDVAHKALQRGRLGQQEEVRVKVSIQAEMWDERGSQGHPPSMESV